MSEQRETAHVGIHYVVAHLAVNSAANRAKPTFWPDVNTSRTMLPQANRAVHPGEDPVCAPTA